VAITAVEAEAGHDDLALVVVHKRGGPERARRFIGSITFSVCTKHGCHQRNLLQFVLFVSRLRLECIDTAQGNGGDT
jgi:hypothetical protein